MPADLAGTGFKTGDIANNFNMLDQHGNQTELYQFYGEIVIVDVFTYW
jgi:peroxiredoxin